MHDFKHIVSSKRESFFSFSKKSNPVNRSLRTTLPSPKNPFPWKKIICLLLALGLVYPLSLLLIAAKRAIPATVIARESKSALKAAVDGPMDVYESFRVAAESILLCRPLNDKLVTVLPDGSMVTYSLDTALQAKVTKVMADNDVPFGVFVAIEPKTGRVLAMASHSTVDPEWERQAFYKLYPMASLFKIITAAAALEQKKVSPDTVVAFRGGACSENPRYWYVKPGRGNQEMNLSIAMGKSVNPVFGRLASDVVGRDSIMTYAERFGFNQTLFPGTQIIPSKANTPQTDAELKLMGAGLGREVKISPLHAAAMMAAIANDGMMMAPLLACEVKDPAGRVLYSEKPEPLRKLVNQETAKLLAKTLSTTVTSGTSRRAFHDRRGRPMLSSVNVAAKTGSINGKDPEGYYNWFAAYAPAEDPQIALVALIINRDKWKIKASYLGEQALEAYFKQ